MIQPKPCSVLSHDIGDKRIVKKLFEVLGPRFKSRPGGYLRVLKKGHKLGDASPVAYVLLSE